MVVAVAAEATEAPATTSNKKRKKWKGRVRTCCDVEVKLTLEAIKGPAAPMGKDRILHRHVDLIEGRAIGTAIEKPR